MGQCNEYVWKCLETMIFWEDVAKMASIWCSNTETGSNLFRTNSRKKFYTHANPMDCYHRPMYYTASCSDTSIIDCVMCLMIPKYNTILPTRLHTLCVGVKWFSTMYLSEKASHFIISTSILTTSSQGITLCKCLQKSTICSQLWEIWLLKSVKFILNHSA